MTTIEINAPGSILNTYIATPDTDGPWHSICVIHDALGMSQDVRNQVDWLASAGYLAAAPDLFDGKTFLGCLFPMMRDMTRQSGPLFDRVEAVRQWLIQHENTTDKAAVIGFCFGGGFALLLAPRGGFSVASVNYGSLPPDPEEYLRQSCPVVGSYGAKDRTLKGAATKLETILTAADVPHDIKEYPDADHAFLNDHSESEIPFMIHVISRVFGGGDYHAESAQDARQRILAFFDEHLNTPNT